MIYRGPELNLNLPDIPLTTFILRHAERLENKPALIDGPSGRTLTYGQLAEDVQRVASGLAHHGFRQGDVFATICPNILEFPIVYYAVALLGGATTMLNPLLTAGEMARQLVDAGARFVLTDAERLDKVREATIGTSIEEIFVVGDAGGAAPFQSLLRHGVLPPVTIRPDDVVTLPYSSGTTGRQKGVMLTHRNHVASVLARHQIDRMGEDEASVLVFPLFHIAGISMLNTTLHAGATLVLMPRFDMRALLQWLQDHRATRIGLPPPVVQELARSPLVHEFHFAHLRHIFWAAAPLAAPVARACQERIGCQVRQAYGLTEACGMTHLAPIKAEERPDSTGLALPGMEYAIVDVVTGALLPPGERGEICLRGPLVMKGYLNQPDATAQTIDIDGWLHTGDLGMADEDGWLYVIDRLKELIKYKGYQVAPAELEAILLSHPAVADAAVIPSPDEEAGEVPKAFAVLRAPALPEELMAYVAACVAPHKKVRRLEIVDQIPKAASGKILRRVLVERERELAARSEPALV